MKHDTILVIDFGSQYTQLITRVVREQAVYSVQKPWHTTQADFLDLQPAGVILSGGPSSIYLDQAPSLPDYLLELDVPILGICYGMQALADRLGGKVIPTPTREYGYAKVVVTEDNNLVPLGDHQVWMSHGDSVEQVPAGFKILASTPHTPIAVMGDPKKRIYGLQFHPEVRHTSIGKDIIKNFLFKICNAKSSWTPSSIVDEKISQIRQIVGSEPVIAGVSGGVDSTVAATIVHKAVGDQLNAVFIDTGLLRKNEQSQVQRTLSKTLNINLHVVDGSESFFEDLKGITDPEQKRIIIGNRFIRLFERVAMELGSPKHLVQGTIYPDVVESAAPDRKESETIKTHHNVGGLPPDLQFNLIEPLRYLFKDEVRLIGEHLGIPKELVWRQPFPGPGLAIRCLGEVNRDKVILLQQVDHIFLEELAAADLLFSPQSDSNSGTSQAFAVLLPIKSVGVMGDQRTYQNVVALRSVSTTDFMTADWSRLPHELLAKVSNRIVNEVQGVNRVVYDITSKPPGTIEWE
jgi:GMP synthase (glutamine-hydrolysing)